MSKTKPAETTDAAPSSVVRYASISLARSVGSILPRSGSRPDAFLADDGYILERDLDRDPNTLRISHRDGVAVRHIPWNGVYDSEVLGAAVASAPAPVKPSAAAQPPTPEPKGPVIVAGARSSDTRDALAYDGVQIATAPKPKMAAPAAKAAEASAKGGWPGGKKPKAEAAGAGKGT
jgi:hypothetical protein